MLNLVGTPCPYAAVYYIYPTVGGLIIAPVYGDVINGDGDDSKAGTFAIVLTFVGLSGERFIMLIYCLKMLIQSHL
jgi:hypothetical protein